MKDPPSKHVKVPPLKPLGDEERRKKLEQPRLVMSTSTKLSASDGFVQTGSLLKEKRQNRLFDTPWEVISVSPTSGLVDQRLLRPDYVGHVQALTAHRCSSASE